MINDGVTVSTGAGNIIINGQGQAVSTNSWSDGVDIGNNLATAKLQTTSGNITINGIGGGGTGGGGCCGSVGIYNGGTNTTASGAIALTGTGGSNANYDNGIDVSGTIQSTATGGITLTGYGGDSGSTGNYGIGMYGTVQSTATGGGGITLIGYAGGNGGSDGYNMGLFINGAVSSVDGNIIIDGNTGNGHAVTNDTGGNDYGIKLEDDNGAPVSITSTGNATITLNGVGGGSGGGLANFGVYLLGWNGYSTTVSSAGGAISITGTGANTSGGGDAGVVINDGHNNTTTSVSSTGAAPITITGTGNGTGSSRVSLNQDPGITVGNDGVDIGGGATVSATSGATSITGVKGSSGSDYGLYTDTNATNTIGGNSTTGNITIIADTWDISNTSDFKVKTTGALLIKPYSSGQAMNIGSNTGGLDLNSNILTDINLASASSLTFGDAVNTGAMDINYSTSIPTPTSFITNGGNITLDSSVASSVTSGTALAFSDPLLVNGNYTVSTGNGNILFSGAINGGHALTVNAGTGTDTFAGIVGGSSALTNFAATGGSIVLGGNVTTSGNQTYTGAVTLGGNDTLSSTASSGNGNITFTSTVGGDYALTATAGSGNVTFEGIVGGTPLASLSASSSTAINVDNNVTTVGNQTYTGPVVLGGNDTLTTTNSAVDFTSTIDGTYTLTIAQGNALTTFGGAVGGGTALRNRERIT